MSIVASALAGGLAGLGRGITAEHKERVEARGLAERRAWEAAQAELDRESADARTAAQVAGQLEATNIRADTAIKTAEIERGERR